MKQKIARSPGSKSLRGKLFRGLILAVYLLCVFLLMDRSLFQGTAMSPYEGTYRYAEPSWVFRHGRQVLDPELETPAFSQMETGELYSISTRLTYDGSTDALPTCFYFVDHMFTRVLLDGREIFHYMPGDIQKPDRSRSPGNVYVSVNLPNNCQGMELEIQFIPALGAGIEFQLPNPRFGNFATATVNTFWNELPHNIIIVLSAVLGIGAVLFSTLTLPGPRYRECLFIGIFATLFSFYNITESDFDFYAIANPYYTYVIDYVTFSSIPIFLMAFLRERLDPRQRSVTLVLILMGVVLFVTEMVLHFTGLWDMREFLTVTHVVYFIDFIIIFVLIVTMKKNQWKTQLILQMIPILAGFFIDAAVYYKHWQLSSSDSTFTAVGVIIFLIAELCHVWKYSMEVYTESIRSQAYRQMAYVDVLTGIGNRRAFEKERSEIAAGRRPCRSLTVVSADVNDLKLTNDTAGHAAGDFLIRSAADVLLEFSGNYGHVYRMGGDEFLLFLYDMEEKELQRRLALLEARIQSVNDSSDTRLSLALGYEVSGSGDPDPAIEAADRKMYLNKAAYKSQQFDPREEARRKIP